MSDKRFVAYYRVSTDEQGRSGLGLAAQRKAVSDYLGQHGWNVIAAFTEIESGKRNDRPQLAAALRACKAKQATLIIAKLDRLARNVAFIANLMESGVPFVAVDRPNAKPFELHIYAAMAEEERRAISERTRAALAAAKARGVRLGSPDPRKAAVIGVQRQRERADQLAESVSPVIAGIRAAGVTTLTGIAEALNARGIPTARGGNWYASTVKNVIARVACDQQGATRP